MEILLRGKKYNAEHLTDLNYLPLGKLFIDDNGEFVLQDVTDYQALPLARKNQLTNSLMNRLVDPDLKSGLAFAINSIFPSIPSELVDYQGKNKFKLNLSLEELLSIANACGNALQDKQPQTKEKPYFQELTVLDEQIAALQSERAKFEGMRNAAV